VFYRPDFSVHDEPTVVGRIPAAALEAERQYALRTAPPPPKEPAAAPVSQPASPGFQPIHQRTTYLVVALAAVLVTAVGIALATR
jgi:hypothetical protein